MPLGRDRIGRAIPVSRAAKDTGRMISSSGRTIRLGPDWYLCRLALPTSLPIPLGIEEPHGLDLVTWAFSGVTAAAADPACLLILRPRDAAARSALDSGTRLVVATHFRAMAVVLPAAEPAETLSQADRHTVARAIAPVIDPHLAQGLSAVFPLLRRALALWPVPDDAPTVTMDRTGRATCTLSGVEMPDYLLFPGEAGVACARVAEARLRFDRAARMDLDLERLWGPDVPPSLDRAILVGAGTATPARLAWSAAP